MANESKCLFNHAAGGGTTNRDYLERYETPKQAAVGYLDDALEQFLSGLERQGVLKDTLVMITSDESHGIRSTWP